MASHSLARIFRQRFSPGFSASSLYSNVIKQLVYASSVRISSYVYTWESTQEARVALGCASSNFYVSLVLSKSPRASITRCTHPKHDPIVT